MAQLHMEMKFLIITFIFAYNNIRKYVFYAYTLAIYAKRECKITFVQKRAQIR